LNSVKSQRGEKQLYSRDVGHLLTKIRDSSSKAGIIRIISNKSRIENRDLILE
jgi:hypothetical protein